MTAGQLTSTPGGLPALDGKFLWAYRLTWFVLAAAAIAVVATNLALPGPSLTVQAARLVKALLVGAAALLLFLRRPRDPVAAVLALAFLCWVVTSSFEFASLAVLPATLDRLRFLLFALALLLFPDGRWAPGWTRYVAAASVATFGLGLAEVAGLTSHLFLPLAILCILAATASLIRRYKTAADEIVKLQLKWVAWGLVLGVGLILAARAAAAAGVGPPSGREILFQTGIIVVAIGFMVPVVRYRLYDAEAVISRSAALAGLTGALVATFAGSEALIETLGQQYLGAGGSNVSSAMAAAIAAVLLTPLHGRISDWAEGRFQADLAQLKAGLPDLLDDMPSTWSPEQVADAALPHIARAIHAIWVEIRFDGRTIASVGATPAEHRPAEALNLPMRCPFGGDTGRLIIGPRPDGSTFGKDERQALSEILAPLRRRLNAAARQAEYRQRNDILLRELRGEIAELRNQANARRRHANVPG